jgi:hypothetical protein
MALSVTVSNDQYPDDQEFEIVGLGAFKNGEAREITEEQEKTFVSLYQMAATDKLGEQDAVTVSGDSTIENIDEVLGVDVSDTPPPPDLEAITAANEEVTATEETPATQETPIEETVTLPEAITSTSGGET